jgi:hypothetical protein
LEQTKPETYKPFPKQQEFHRNPAKYRLFGGAAGPGKSRSLLEEGCMQAWEVDGADTLILRRSYKELEKSIISQFRRHILPQWMKIGARYLESDKLVYWPNGSKTYFGFSENLNDIYQYQGMEALFIGVDELTLFTLKQWQFLTSRNRCAVPGSYPCMAGATNPGNVGHAWVKALWVDKKPPAEMEDSNLYDPADYAFIKALIWDNPIYAEDKNYLKTLQHLPTYMRQMWLEGEWNLHVGTYFDIFNPSQQVVHAIELKPWYPRWISLDWGFAHNSAAYWHATLPDGRTYTYREFVGNQMTPNELGTEIAKRSAGEKIDSVYISPDTYARRESPDTVALMLSNALEFNGLPRGSKADDERIGGWVLMYQTLKSGHWIIDRDCVALIECIPTLTRDPDNPEDVLKVEGDDPADSARYGLKSRLSPGQAPIEVRIEDRITALNERRVNTYQQPLTYTAKQHLYPKLLREEQKAQNGQPFSMRRPARHGL